MSDIFAPLRDPDQVSSLPPAEVRRRGDRLRRRRAGLVLVGTAFAAATLVGGLSLLLGEPPSSDSGPVDSPGVESLIPPQLDLASGMSRIPERPTAHPGALKLLVCGETSAFAEGAIAHQFVRVSQGSDLSARGLSVYPDASTAEAAAAGLAAEFRGCPRFTDERGRTWTTTVRWAPEHGEPGWVVTRDGDGPGTRADFPDVVQIVRLGPNLLVVQEREVHGVAMEDLARWVRTQVGWLMDRQMCTMTEEGCAWRDDPDVLQPEGWGPLRLGRSSEDLDPSVEVDSSDAGECTTAEVAAGTGWFSGSGRLVSIEVPRDVTTPDGIGVGAGREQVLDTYPFEEVSGPVVLVRASATADYELTFTADRVTRLRLVDVGYDCSD
ncbi:hypothetical protein [Nocardioides piscis]|uniref:Uncharacterized protein n=1 Tax=Nocardioides piscis TaxID=2714938 RepID=A0A6G7YIT4_9ACTN|nr:hypothetical protein [Nocardioides piscis]QIK76646.1 hypothetical protein G7071_15660 [Nocardioides piscis]